MLEKEQTITIEDPLARYLQQRFGDKWKDKALEAARSRSMLRRNGYTLRYTKGLIHGNFSIAEGIRWQKSCVLLYRAFPESIVASLKGRKIKDVVSHPILDGNMKINNVKQSCKSIVFLDEANQVNKEECVMLELSVRHNQNINFYR
jgi:hypothetical protein